MLEGLIKNGPGALTAVRIAEETGVARSTIHRYWPDRTALLLDTIDKIVNLHVPTTIIDNFKNDLTSAPTDLRTRMTKRPFRIIFGALLDHAKRNHEAGAAQRRFVNGILQPINDILTAARERGELPPTT